MYIKQLIKDKGQYWNFVWQFVEWATNPDRSLWRDEDYPKLQPFFAAQQRGTSIQWTEEVQKSFDFYDKCRKEYGDDNATIRDAMRQFSPDDVLEGFGFEINMDDEEYEKDIPLELHKDFEATFPFIVIGEISSEFDRLGKIRTLAINFVSKKDFENA
jgi:hypothetical protein